MSKSSELDRQVKLYLLDVMSEGRESEQLNINDSIKYWNATFLSEFGWRVEKIGMQAALTEWLQGLALNIDFCNWDILKLAVKWGSIPENHTEKQAEKILENYWVFMAAKLNQLFKGYRVPKDMSDYIVDKIIDKILEEEKNN